MSADPLAALNDMRRRATTYTILALLAVILTVLPSAIWPDLVIPVEENWENWYWKGQPHARPDFSLTKMPPLFRAELAVYRTLVVPPAYAKRLFTGVPTHYAAFWIEPYLETAGVPPLAHALNHAEWALPFWLIVLATAYEVAAGTRRLLQRQGQDG